MIQSVVEGLFKNPAWLVLKADRLLFDQARHLHGSVSDKAWSLTDCSSFVVMSERGIWQALAHDHHFQQAGFEALLRRDPP
jgi:predicted nucleic acid-binding protein